MALTNFIVARPKMTAAAEPSVSVIVPARNEAGNVHDLLPRIPVMGRGTEVVFVEGHSRDNTLAMLREEVAAHPDVPAMVLTQTGEGKGDAVRLGFERATGDILMILDADLTVSPDDLPRFYEAIRNGSGEFVNGVRLVYPMADDAMQLANLLANKVFGWLFSWILGQPIRDTLCGTKVLWRRDYERIAANRARVGLHDPFGDFDLLFGAAAINLRLIEMPVRYGDRRYGKTNVRRWAHGWLLLKMSIAGARRLKFV
jgi:glycosyltransferase involved in cell wall biosynthesis